ncbi:MAG: hypothetical protein OES38_07105 [Gammaproteobacteria bacterium]|nr:hypothetical protein [Gammaproteobacteria bacterium]
MPRLRALVPWLLLLSLGLCAACEPVDRRPGTWLSGELAATPASWDFTEDHQEIFVETTTWYGVPHSVTTVVAARGDTLYVPSIYDQPADFPGSKRWNKNIASDPAVRLKIGDSIYELRARPVTDEGEFQNGFAALAGKYDFWKQGLEDPERRPPFVIIAMEPR